MGKYKRNRFGSIIMDGFTITRKEQNEYVKRVKRANTKRQYLIDKYYEQAKNTPNMVGVSKEAYARLLEEKGFITEKLTTSLHGLSSKQEFKEELKDLKTINKKGYNENKVEELRKRMLKTINYNLGNSGQDIYNTIANMNISELASMYIHSPVELIAELFDSDGSVDEQEERAEKTRSTMEILSRNVTEKDKREQRVNELKNTYVKRPRIIRNKKSKRK